MGDAGHNGHAAGDIDVVKAAQHCPARPHRQQARMLAARAAAVSRIAANRISSTSESNATPPAPEQVLALAVLGKTFYEVQSGQQVYSKTAVGDRRYSPQSMLEFATKDCNASARPSLRRVDGEVQESENCMMSRSAFESIWGARLVT